MAALSPLQIFPLHIVKNIVSHLPNKGRLVPDAPDADSEEDLKPLIPLLWTCHIFRAVVYSRFSARYELLLDSSRDAVDAQWISWPRCLRKTPRSASHLVSELTITLSIRTASRSEALEMLSHTLYSGCTFTKARSLILNFFWLASEPENRGGPISILDTKADIHLFVQGIKHIAPAVSDISVCPSRAADDLTHRSSRYFGNLVAQLYQLGSRIMYTSHFLDVPMQLQLDTINGLVHINYCMNCYTDTGNRTQLMQLARLNAPTLQLLAIKMQPSADISSLFLDTDGSYAEYSQLHTLKLELSTHSTSSPQSGSTSVVPFPHLRHLAITAEYPFDDDTPFRGNATTLEYLKLRLRDSTFEMLDRYRVFTPTSHPRLRYVCIRPYS
ncbi:hypothetical protein GGF44_002357, partial [Coemansia sp. RSA 1694]